MHVALRTPLALLVVLLACDSATPEAGGKAAVDADARAAVNADAKVALDTKAIADAATSAAVVVTVPPLRAVADVEAALGGRALVLRAADLDLKGVVDLVATGKVHSAAELELLLNAPGGAAHKIDIDADGALDYLQVVEVRAGGAVNFEIRAIPSSKLDLSLAVLVATVSTVRAEAEGAIKIAANYAAAVEGGADFNVHHDLKADFKGGAIVLADASAGAFAGWAVDLSRTAYVSAHLSPVDINLVADGSAQFVGDASASLEAARLAALRAALKVELLAAIEPPKVAVDIGAKAGAGANAGAKAGVKVEHSAKAESSVKVGSGGGVKVGGSVGVGGGISVGGGGKGKAGGGIKIGG